TSNAQAIGASNPQGRATIFRYFDPETGNGDPVDDLPFQTHKVKGTTLWGYARETAKLSSEPWEEGDEICLGAEYVTDEAAPPSSRTGFIKYTWPFGLQYTDTHIAIAPSGSSAGSDPPVGARLGPRLHRATIREGVVAVARLRVELLEQRGGLWCGAS